MVRAWIADIRPLCEEKCYRKYYEKLPDFRKKKADALRSVQGKAQSVGYGACWKRFGRRKVCLNLLHIISPIPEIM